MYISMSFVFCEISQWNIWKLNSFKFFKVSRFQFARKVLALGTGRHLIFLLVSLKICQCFVLIWGFLTDLYPELRTHLELHLLHFIPADVFKLCHKICCLFPFPVHRVSVFFTCSHKILRQFTLQQRQLGMGKWHGRYETVNN